MNNKYFKQKSEITGNICVWLCIGNGNTVVVTPDSVTVYDFDFTATNHIECSIEEYQSVLRSTVKKIIEKIL